MKVLRIKRFGKHRYLLTSLPTQTLLNHLLDWTGLDWTVRFAVRTEIVWLYICKGLGIGRREWERGISSVHLYRCEQEGNIFPRNWTVEFPVPQGKHLVCRRKVLAEQLTRSTSSCLYFWIPVWVGRGQRPVFPLLYFALNWTVRFCKYLSSFVGRLNSGRRGLEWNTGHWLAILRDGILTFIFYFYLLVLPLRMDIFV